MSKGLVPRIYIDACALANSLFLPGHGLPHTSRVYNKLYIGTSRKKKGLKVKKIVNKHEDGKRILLVVNHPIAKIAFPAGRQSRRGRATAVRPCAWSSVRWAMDGQIYVVCLRDSTVRPCRCYSKKKSTCTVASACTASHLAHALPLLSATNIGLCEIFLDFDTITISFLFNKYCLIIE